MDYNAYFKANNDIGSVPVCFDECVTNLESGGLSGDEKNCMRECYMKRISAKDDINMMMVQKMGREQIRRHRQAYQ